VKVLHLVSSPTMTGPADPALQLAAAQRVHLDYDARIAFDQRRTGDMHRHAAALGVPVVSDLTVCTKGTVGEAFNDRRRLRQLADEYDVVHAHASHDHALASFAKGRAKLIRSIHHPRNTARRPFQRFAFGRTDGFIVVAGAHRTRLMASYPTIPGDRIIVVPGAVDPERYHADLDGGAFREAHQIPPDALVIGMVARFQAGRGQPALIEAVRGLGTAHVALIGKGETQPTILEAIESAKLTERVHLYGFRDHDLPEAFASCDVTVLLREGNDASCRAILQSMACGIPVIGARYAAMEDAIEDGMTGLLVPPDDAESLQGALRRFAALTPEARTRMGEAARARILAQHTERARGEAVDAFYRAVER